jgi:predicted deacetylase
MGMTASFTRFYVPELHDIHPGMESSVEDLMAVLPKEARALTALLIVPNWHGAEPIDRDGPLLAQLARMQGDMVLHGYTHSLGRDWLNSLLYGHENRSEFRNLDSAEARRRLELGLAMLREAGLDTRWFCAPRWHQSMQTREVLAALGFAGWHFAGALETVRGERIALPALCFDEGERPIRIAVTRLLRSLDIRRLLGTGRPFRLTLHPADRLRPAIWDQIADLVAQLQREGYEALSLDQAVTLWRRNRGVTEAPTP